MRMVLATFTAAAGLFIIFGCKPAGPAFRVEVPRGWKVQRDFDDQKGTQAKFLHPEPDVAGVWIAVVCEPAAPNTEFLNVSRSLEDGGARILDLKADALKGAYEMTFAIEDETGPARGKIVIKPDSGKHGRTIMLQGLWPEARHAEMTGIFDTVAASADYR